MSEDVEGVSRRLVDDGQTMNLVMAQHVDGIEETRVRVDVNQRLRIVIQDFCNSQSVIVSGSLHV